VCTNPPLCVFVVCVYTQRADLHDKLVVFPSRVGHFKNIYIFYSVERGRTDRVGAEMCVCVCVCVCVRRRRERENINSQWGQSNKEVNSSRFLSHTHTHTHTHIHTHALPDRREHADYISPCRGPPTHAEATLDTPPTHTGSLVCSGGAESPLH